MAQPLDAPPLDAPPLFAPPLDAPPPGAPPLARPPPRPQGARVGRARALRVASLVASLVAGAVASAAGCATTREAPDEAPPPPPRDEPPLEIIIIPKERPSDRRRAPRAPPEGGAAPRADEGGDAPRADEGGRDGARADGRDGAREDARDGARHGAREPGRAERADDVLPVLGRGDFPDAPPPEPPGLDRATTMTMHVLDVGQGAATLLELSCGAILVDTGGEMNGDFDAVDALTAQLDAFFARRKDLRRTIDVLVITHPHIDHVRGVPAVLSRYDVKHVVESGLSYATNVRTEMQRLRDFAAQRPKAYRAIEREAIGPGGFADAVVDPLACKPVDPVVRVLSGRVASDPGWRKDRHGKESFGNANNHSVVVRVDFGASSVLITGDLEEPAIDDLVAKYEGSDLLDVDVYVAGHHGSYNGTTAELVEAMSPEVAVIQMGAEWRHRSWSAWQYGHPRDAAVRLLREGVSQTRRPRVARIGTKSRTFLEDVVDEAVYATGWDGPLAIDLAADGTVSPRTPAR